MMADRYKPIFLAIISLTIVWFIIVLLCLPQQNDDLLLDHHHNNHHNHHNQHHHHDPDYQDKQQQQQQQWPSLGQLTKSAATPSIFSINDEQTINYSLSTGRRRRHHNHHHNHQQQQQQQHEHHNNHDHIDSIVDEDEHYPKRIPNYMRYFQLSKRHPELSKLDIIFYQLNTTIIKYNDSEYFLRSDSIAKDQHLKETLNLKTINNPTDRYVKSEGDRLFAFNLLVSNRIGLIRPLPDTRHTKCTSAQSVLKKQQPLKVKSQSQSLGIENAKQPSKASIIICYYNEAPSALLRTIYSILKRTDPQYMQEIIVVDDSSENEYDITKIKPFINDPLIILTRTDKREGLIRARLFGSNLARGQILLFLDSHVEPNVGWIEPLIETVRENTATIACPIIDLINAETLIYTSSPLVKGGMNWALNFKWDSVPTEKLKTYDDFVKPIESPTMAGGLFAIDKGFFQTIGTYDSGMELWGGENIELSLRTWMCGGKIVILPCSRVGHIFRKRRPYGPEPDQPDSLLLNSHRVARVWLDTYIDRFYEANPDAKYLISGDVSKRLDLKHKLGCKNFTWFLENIYPDLIVQDKIPPMVADSSRAKPKAQRNSRPQRQIAATTMQQQQQQQQLQRYPTGEGGVNMMQSLMIDSENDRLTGGHRSASSYLPKMIVQFQIQSKNSDLCIESKRIHTGGGFTRLVLNRCAQIERNNEGEILINNSTILDQIWTETELHDLRLGPNRCLDVFKNLPLLRKCHNMGSFQDWSHNPANYTSDTNIFNTRAGLCLGVERVQIEEPIIVTICDKETYKRHNYTAAKLRYQSWRWRQTTQLATTGLAPKSPVAGLVMMRRPQEYHLNQTKPSQGWNLLLVNNSLAMQDMMGTTTTTTTNVVIGDSN